MTESPARFPYGTGMVTPASAGATYIGRRARGFRSGYVSIWPLGYVPHPLTGGRAHHSRCPSVESPSRLPTIDLDSAACAGGYTSQFEVFHAHPRHALEVCPPPFSIVEEGQQPFVFRRHEFDGKIEIGAGSRSAICSAAKDKKRPDLRLIASPGNKYMPRKLFHGRRPEAALLAMFCLYPRGHKPTSASLPAEAP